MVLAPVVVDPFTLVSMIKERKKNISSDRPHRQNTCGKGRSKGRQELVHPTNSMAFIEVMVATTTTTTFLFQITPTIFESIKI